MASSSFSWLLRSESQSPSVPLWPTLHVRSMRKSIALPVALRTQCVSAAPWLLPLFRPLPSLSCVITVASSWSPGSHPSPVCPNLCITLKTIQLKSQIIFNSAPTFPCLLTLSRRAKVFIQWPARPHPRAFALPVPLPGVFSLETATQLAPSLPSVFTRKSLHPPCSDPIP